MKTLSIVIPVYNGANSIERLVRELAALNEVGWELILVNDCSPDDSWAIIERLAKEAPMPIIAVDLARNFGEHNAVMAGYAVSSGNHVINIDDDFQNPPSEVIKLLKFAQDNPQFDVIYTKYKRKQHNFLRNLGSRFNDRVATFLLDKPRGLYLSSFRCVNRFLCDGILEYGGPYPYIDGIILETREALAVHVRELLGNALTHQQYHGLRDQWRGVPIGPCCCLRKPCSWHAARLAFHRRRHLGLCRYPARHARSYRRIPRPTILDAEGQAAIRRAH